MKVRKCGNLEVTQYIEQLSSRSQPAHCNQSDIHFVTHIRLSYGHSKSHPIHNSMDNSMLVCPNGYPNGNH